MRFRLSTDQLTEALSIVTRALSARSTLPVLEGVFIETTDSGLRLTCSDGSISIVTTCDAEIEEEGTVVLPGRLFYEVVRKMPDGIVTGAMNDRLAVTFRCAGSRTTLSGQSADSFPALPSVNPDQSLKIPQKIFKEMITQTSFNISTDESRMVLTGSLLEVEHGTARMVALDGFRLGMRSLLVDGEAADFRAIIPGKTLSEIVKLLSDSMDETASLTFGGSQMVMELQNTRIYSVLIEGEFIQYRQILPADWKSRVKVQREAFAPCVERASLMAREGKNNLIRMHITDGRMEITSNAESGDVFEELPIELEGEELNIAFNVKYIGDVLRALTDDEIYLRFNSSVSPCVICPVDGDGYLYLVLPVRVNA